ncbi:acetyltransferase (GNAT) family protein [Micromonospora pisi]|uniref:Acetyltransferase (GNAT) family protein n=1 Tax=Micromonospora pisi TaxID=589240 RepID=A0A495JBT5_9ACTN|nr:GNAT family N-acetyltransferase [Micromonospora pisi]RKR86456.1 acetyltransferase (GNAT) family protein [Micromonospora pisi]
MTRENDRYVIRPGRACDAVELARLHASVQLQTVTNGQPHPGIAAWVEDLLDGHPSVAPDDFLVAEDSATGRPVASLVGLRQDWCLAGVRLPVAQVELVGTASEHRGNRLTERLFAALHQRYAVDGVPVQIIEGIPYFYRRLGYDYALANDGAALVPVTALPAIGQDRSDGSSSGPMVRPATVADADALADIDQRLADVNALVCARDAEVWRYEIAGRRPADIARREVAVLVHGADVRGYLVHGARLSAAGELIVVAAACERPADWPQAAAAMHAHLNQVGRQYEASADRPFAAVRPILDPNHPLARLGPPGVVKRPRGWYVRTGNPVDLLARLQPLLRNRWHTAELRWPEPALTIDTYGHAARLEFTDGELTAVTAIPGAVSPSTDPRTHAAIPPGALLQLSIGHRTLPEVLGNWPDCLLRDRFTEHFLTAAFPHVPVRVWPRN